MGIYDEIHIFIMAKNWASTISKLKISVQFYVNRGVNSELALVIAFKEKMETEEAKKIYKKRGPVAEFTNAWIKTKIGLRQFSVQGLKKAEMELQWACLTLNIQQWIRLKHA